MVARGRSDTMSLILNLKSKEDHEKNEEESLQLHSNYLRGGGGKMINKMKFNLLFWFFLMVRWDQFDVKENFIGSTLMVTRFLRIDGLKALNSVFDKVTALSQVESRHGGKCTLKLVSFTQRKTRAAGLNVLDVASLPLLTILVHMWPWAEDKESLGACYRNGLYVKQVNYNLYFMIHNHDRE